MSFSVNFRRPSTYIPTVFALVAFGFAIFAYYDTQEVREISYRQSQIKIYDSESSTASISVYDKQNHRIDDNVYVSEFIVWNSGNSELPIGKVRAPLSFVLHGDGTIIDYKLTEETHPNISKFSLSTTNDNKNAVVSWSYFDPNMGFKTQIFYTGDDAQITIEGLVSVGSKIFEVKKGAITKSKALDSILTILSIVLLAALVMLFFNYVIGGFDSKLMESISTRMQVLLACSIVLAAGVLLIGGVYGIFYLVFDVLPIAPRCNGLA